MVCPKLEACRQRMAYFLRKPQYRIFYELAYNKLNIIESTDNEGIPTMGVAYNKTKKIVDLYYNKDFVEKESVDYLFLVFLHEMCHVYMAHLCNPLEELGVPHELGNIVYDHECNMFIKNAYIAENKNFISYEAEHDFLKRSYYPAPDDQKTVSDGIGTMFIWYRFQKAHPKEFYNGLGEKTKPEKNGGKKDKKSSHLGIGSMTRDDLYSLSPDLASRLSRAKQETVSSASKIQSFSEQKLGRTNTNVVTQLLDFCNYMLRKYGEQRSFKRPHKLNICGIVEPLLQTYSLKFIPKILFFIDTSGSMAPEKLKKIWSCVGSILQEFGDVNFVMCDTEIKKRGILRNPEDISTFVGGGGTEFADSVEELAKEGFTHFWFYTDGQFSNFTLPSSLNPNEQVWLLVDDVNFEMPGVKIQVEGDINENK